MSWLAATVFLIVTFPIVIWIAWSDLKTMRIPNKANIALFLVFLILGPLLLTLPEYGFRLLQAAIVLVIAFLANMAGLMGGGDSKLFAALSPFIAIQEATAFFFILALFSLAAVALHRLIPRIKPAFRMIKDWQSFSEKKHFPFGLPLAGSLTGYLALSVFG